MDTPQPPEQPPYQPPPVGPTAQPAPPTEPGEVTEQNAAGQAQQQQQQPPYQAPYAQQGFPQPYGYQQPYAQQPYAQQQYQQPYAYQQPGAYYAATGYYNQYNAGPDNGLATSSLITSVLSIGALVFTAGLSAPLSLIASIVSIFLGQKGKKAVDEGRTRKNRDMAVAGFWTGIAGVALSVIAIALWVVFFVALSETGGEADPGDLASLFEFFGAITGA